MDETKQYSNRELYLLLDKNNEMNQLQHTAIIQSIQAFHDKTEGTLKTILEQTTKTNGRVNKLEGWRMYMAGGIALFCLVGLPMIWMLINDVRGSRDLINAHIARDK
jgi:hypothetical protein